MLPVIGTFMVGSSCAEPFGPSKVRLADLEAKAVLSPTRIARRDSLEVRVSLLNHSKRDTTVGFAVGCPFYLEASWLGETPVELEGTAYGWTTAGSAAEIGAEDSVV
ncbi:MAG: hypothetical protein GWN06_02190 [Gemmatimonadetes bacterium]|nr:hypothetical protein [Gemmatimonadota bacterium]